MEIIFAILAGVIAAIIRIRIKSYRERRFEKALAELELNANLFIEFASNINISEVQDLLKKKQKVKERYTETLLLSGNLYREFILKVQEDYSNSTQNLKTDLYKTLSLEYEPTKHAQNNTLLAADISQSIGYQSYSF